MAPSTAVCAKYQYVVTSAGPKIVAVDQPSDPNEENAAEYNAGGYLNITLNDNFKNGRYRVLRKLGWGHFSTVWLVKDSLTNRHSALKVVKSANRYAETARDEIKLLSKVSNASPDHPGRSHIVSFLDSFSHSPSPSVHHICIVFEPLGENLLALIERNKKKGVPRALVKLIARQVLLGLEYLHDECDLVHTDIKPENILISIPDIETHISTELSVSPSPTSRRVGVPPPSGNKSRPPVSIPSRRQVQIFDSQPLSSPGRGGSGTNSASGSFVAQMHMARLAGSHGTLGGSPVKLTQCQPDVVPVASPHAKSGLGLAPASPSTSSTSSSVSSNGGKGTHSIISTPPTSVSHSLGAGSGGLGMSLLGMSMASAADNSISGALVGDADRVRVDVVCVNDQLEKKQKQKQKKEKAVPPTLFRDDKPSSSVQHSSWTERLSSSWKSSTSFSSSGRSSGSGSATKKHGKRTSILGGGTWKDPGAAAPAPALVISESVHGGSMTAIDPDEDDLAEDERNRISSQDQHASTRSSSATVTLVGNITQQQRDDLLNKPYTVEPRTSVTIPLSQPAARITAPLNSSNKAAPSLLSQTAPNRKTPPSAQRSISARPPPALKVSQLSAHIHDEAPASFDVCAANASHTHVHNPLHIQQPRNSHLHNRGGEEKDMNQCFCSSATVSSSLTPKMTSPSAPPSSPCVSETPKSPLSFPSSTQHINIPPTTVCPPSDEDFSIPSLPPPVSIKIADLGNATPSRKHFTEDIQTRQYRSPEAIIGRKDWGTRVDVWSVACVIFELLTAEYLFDPQGQGDLFAKDDDHMAQIIELLGDFPNEVKMGGKYSSELFDRHGGLRFIKTLKPWPLKRVMIEKYLFSETDAADLCAFLEPMLAVDMRKRKEARDMVDHVWLQISEADEFVGEW